MNFSCMQVIHASGSVSFTRGPINNHRKVAVKQASIALCTAINHLHVKPRAIKLWKVWYTIYIIIIAATLWVYLGSSTCSFAQACAFELLHSCQLLHFPLCTCSLSVIISFSVAQPCLLLFFFFVSTCPLTQPFLEEHLSFQ